MKYRKTKILIFLIFLMAIIIKHQEIQVSAQVQNNLPPSTIEFEHISVEDGLSSPIVYDIIQDTYGFIWIATANGLNKYDGYEITTYYPDPDNPSNPNSVSGNQILDILLDSDGIIWIGTDNGLNSYNPKTDNFEHWFHQPNASNSLSNNLIYKLIQDNNGDLWIATGGGGVDHFDPITNSFTHHQHSFSDSNSLISNSTYSVFQDSLGDIWVGTNAGLDKYSQEFDIFTHYSPGINSSQNISFGIITSIMEDSEGYLWITSMTGGLNKFDKSTNTFTHFTHDPNNPDSIGNNDLTNIFEDSNGTLWVPLFNSGSLDVYDRANDKFIHYEHDPNVPSSIASNSVVSIFEDNTGVLWFSTYNGISKYDRKTERFSLIKNNINDQNSLSDNDIHAIFEDSYGYLWVGTESGLNRYNPSTGSYIRYLHDPENPDSIASNSVVSIDEDENGDIWLATNVGVDKYVRSENIFIHFQKESGNANSLQENVARSIMIDSDGYIWVGTQSLGLNRYDQIEHTWKVYPTSNFVKVIYESESGDIYASGDLGLYRYNIQTDTFDLVGNKTDDPKSISNNKINSIFEDSYGNFWLGTENGLNYFDPETNEFTHFLASAGLIDSWVNGIREGEDGHLWISTPKGLSEFSIATQEFRNYDIASFSRSSNIKSRTGELFFGTNNGIISFYPENITDNSFVPEIAITSIKVLNEEIDYQEPVWEITQLDLSYTENFFSFEFSALDFSDSEKNQYMYMLENFDSDWIPLPSDRRYVSYTSIDGGDYTFRVIGSNNDGVWNEEGVNINIHITPPFWTTWWFYLIVILIVFGIFSIIYQAKANEFKAERIASDALRKSEEALKLYSEQLEDKVDERTKELRDTQDELIKKEKFAVLGELAGGVAHELRNPLSVISNSVYYLNSITDTDQKEKRQQYLDMIFAESKNAAKIISDLLNFARKSSIDPGLTDFSEVLSHALVKEPTAENINLILDIPNDLAKLYTDPLHTEQILMNILTNSFHSMDSSIKLDSFMVVPDGGDLKISARNYKDRVIIRIEDTGCGISKENLAMVFEPLFSTKIRGIGLGLSITKNLVELNGGTISVDSVLGEGTTLTINFPAFIE